MRPQLSLPLIVDALPDEYFHIFRNLYFHLYSNSNASRAERIFEDLGKLLLVKAVTEQQESQTKVKQFLDGQCSANSRLLPLLVRAFPHLIDKADHFTIGDDAIRKGLRDLEGIRLSSQSPTLLGEAFQALMGPRLRGDKGQFFTPRSLVRAMVRIASPRPEHKIVDPAAGTGGFLIEAYLFKAQQGTSCHKWGEIIGLEKDRDLYRLGGAMVEIATSGTGRIIQADSLNISKLKGFKDKTPWDADIVLTNPPFGSRIGIGDPKILSEFALGHIWDFSNVDGKWHQMDILRLDQDPQLLFLELSLRLLKPGGLLGIILPEGVFGNRNAGYIWDYIRSVGEIEKLIDCPRTTFQPGTDTKTNVLFVRKQLSKKSSNGYVMVAVAKACGHDRRGRTRTGDGKRIKNDFDSLVTQDGKLLTEAWSNTDIKDPYYLVPRYYSRATNEALEKLALDLDADIVPLGDLVRRGHLIIRKGHEVGAEMYGSGEIPFIRTSDISNWEISSDPINGLSEKVFEEFRPLQNLQPYDILLVVDGRYKIGRSAILQPENCRAVVQSHFRIITLCENSPVSSYELLYLLTLPCVLDEMRNLVFIQSTLGSIGGRLSELRIPIPRHRIDAWQNRIQAFRTAIEGRANLLKKLAEIKTDEPEL